MAETRTENTVRNATVNIVFQIINSILMFVCRTIFVKLLPIEYLGINGLFSNILTVLNLSELGIGSVILVNLYKPLANGDDDTVNKLMLFYKDVYKYVSIFVIIVGMAILPFLGHLVKTAIPIPNINIIYTLFVINSATSYLFSYKKSILIAQQKEYICVINASIFKTITYILQIVVLIITNNFLLYLVCDILCSIIANVVINKRAEKEFPIRATASRFNKKERRSLYRNALAMSSHKIGSVVINSTDSILISSLVSTSILGVFSNYLLITSVVKTYINIAFTSPSASLGNYIATKSKDEVYEMYENFLFIAFWAYGFCAITLYTLLTPFIDIWFGEGYLLSDSIVFLLVANFFLMGVLGVTTSYTTLCSLYNKTKYKPILMSILNLGSSIILGKAYGLWGILFGTLISIICIDIWYDSYVLIKVYFKENYGKYILRWFAYVFLIIVVGMATKFIAGLIASFAIKMLLCIFVPNIALFIFFRKTHQFKYSMTIISSIVKRISHKKRRKFV